MINNFILDGHEPVLCDDLMVWAVWFEVADKHVAKTNIAGVRISTVFLGLDHSFGEGPLLLFETMIFGGKHDQGQWRYSTWEQAETGHEKAVELVFGNGFMAVLYTIARKILDKLKSLRGKAQ